LFSAIKKVLLLLGGSKSMKILIIEPYAHLSGHYSQELHSYCKHLSASINAFDVIDIITPYGFKDLWEPIPHCRYLSLLGESSYAILSQKNSLSLLYKEERPFYLALRKYLKSNRYDIIHLWDCRSIFPLRLSLLGVIKDQHVVMTLKAVEKKRTPIGGINLFSKIQRVMANMLLRSLASIYIVHTPELHRQAVGIGISANVLEIVPTGIERFSQSLKKHEARKIFSLPDEATIMLFFGVHRDEKGIVEALAFAKDLPEDTFYFIVGEDRTNGKITNFIDTMNIQEKVFLRLCYIEESDVANYFVASDLIYIGHQEQFVGESGVFLQAMRYGVPALTCEGSNAAQIIHEYDVGKTFARNDRCSFIHALEWISILDVQQRTEIENNIRRFCADRSWDTIVQKYFQIYSRLFRN
jgi:glycosyltransferase involved in cell wall biosynthesis